VGYHKEIDRENQEIDIDVHDALSAVFGPPVVSTEDIVVYSGAPRCPECEHLLEEDARRCPTCDPAEPNS